MIRTRCQKGYLYKKGNLWLLRYYDNQELQDGTITRVQKAHKLVEAVGDNRTKAQTSATPPGLHLCRHMDEWFSILGEYGRVLNSRTIGCGFLQLN